MRTQFCESKDSWARRFRKTSANILLNPAGVDSARRRGLGRNAGNLESKMLGAFGHHITMMSKLKGQHPRHPPRAFPLGLLAPRCLGTATAQIPGNEPLPVLLGERKSPLPGSGSPTQVGVCPRHPFSSFSFLCLMCHFRY